MSSPWRGHEGRGGLGCVDCVRDALIARALGRGAVVKPCWAPGTAKAEDASDPRNGAGGKTVLTEEGPRRIAVPHDREASFELVLTPKDERRFTGFDDESAVMYARRDAALDSGLA